MTSAASRDHHVLLVSDRYLPEVGGSITWFDNVYRRFPAGTVEIVTQDYPGAREFDAGYALPVHRVSLKRHRFLKPESLMLYMKLTARTALAAARARTDVIHVGKVLPDGYPAWLMSKLRSMPYIVYAHGEEITIFHSNAAYRKTLDRIYNGAAAVVANSGFTRTELIRIGVAEERIHSISPGVDPDTFTPGPADEEIRNRYGLEGKTVLLTVGRLTRRKGHDHVLEALPAVLAENPQVVYLILSEGEEKERLVGLARDLGIEHAVRFAGQVAQERLPDFYRTSDIFVMANRSLPGGDVEGFGIVYLEANACGKPVIAGMSGGTGEPVRAGENGLRVDGGSVTAITEAIISLVRDPSLRIRMGEIGRRIVSREYAWPVVADRIQVLSERVASGHPVR